MVKAHYNPYLQHWWLKFLEVESNFVDMVRLRERVTLAISPFFLFANTHLTDSIGQGHEERGIFYGLLTMIVLSVVFMAYAFKLDRDEKRELEMYMEKAKKYQ